MGRSEMSAERKICSGLTETMRVGCRLNDMSFRRVHKIAKIDSLLRHVCPSDRPPAWNNVAPTERIIMKFDICGLLENLSIKFKFH